MTRRRTAYPCQCAFPQVRSKLQHLQQARESILCPHCQTDHRDMGILGCRTPEELWQGRRAGYAGIRFVPRPPLIGNGAVFVDAPHVLLPVDLTGHGATSLDAFGAAEASTTTDDPALKPRGWWRTDPTRTRTDGLEESLAFLRDILRTQRFEVRF